MEDVKAPRPEESLPTYFKPDDMSKLLKAVQGGIEMGDARRDDQWLLDFLHLALYTGARRNEILHLRWRDIDFSSGLVTFRNTQAHSTKTGKERAVPMVAAAREVLRRLYREHTAEGSVIGLDDRVLTDRKGKPIKPHRASSRLKHYVREAKLPDDLHLHDLRHTAASWLVQAGESLYTVQQILGHSTPVVAQRYAHHAPDALRAAMERAFGAAAASQ